MVYLQWLNWNSSCFCECSQNKVHECWTCACLYLSVCKICPKALCELHPNCPTSKWFDNQIVSLSLILIPIHIYTSYFLCSIHRSCFMTIIFSTNEVAKKKWKPVRKRCIALLLLLLWPRMLIGERGAHTYTRNLHSVCFFFFAALLR